MNTELIDEQEKNLKLELREARIREARESTRTSAPPPTIYHLENLRNAHATTIVVEKVLKSFQDAQRPKEDDEFDRAEEKEMYREVLTEENAADREVQIRIVSFLPCTCCGAGYGEPCRTKKTRKPLSYYHQYRGDLAESLMRAEAPFKQVTSVERLTTLPDTRMVFTLSCGHRRLDKGDLSPPSELRCTTCWWFGIQTP